MKQYKTNMGSTPRGSGTLKSVRAVWGIVLWLSDTLHFQARVLTHLRSVINTPQSVVLFSVSPSSCEPNNMWYLSKFVSLGKPSDLY